MNTKLSYKVTETSQIENELMSNELFVDYSLPDKKNLFVIELKKHNGVSGKFVINPNKPVTTNSIVAGSLNFEPFIKKIIYTENDILLRSVNTDESDIIIGDFDYFIIWGVAIRVAD